MYLGLVNLVWQQELVFFFYFSFEPVLRSRYIQNVATVFMLNEGKEVILLAEQAILLFLACSMDSRYIN